MAFSASIASFLYPKMLSSGISEALPTHNVPLPGNVMVNLPFLSVWFGFSVKENCCQSELVMVISFLA
ncbi:hypothetical protein ES703_101014 [subsurface metagenome]